MFLQSANVSKEKADVVNGKEDILLAIVLFSWKNIMSVYMAICRKKNNIADDANRGGRNYPYCLSIKKCCICSENKRNRNSRFLLFSIDILRTIFFIYFFDERNRYACFCADVIGFADNGVKFIFLTHNLHIAIE